MLKNNSRLFESKVIPPFIIIADRNKHSLTQTEREGGRGRERDGVVGVFPRSVDSAPGGNFAKMAHITASTGGKDAANMYRVGDYVSTVQTGYLVIRYKVKSVRKSMCPPD